MSGEAARELGIDAEADELPESDSTERAQFAAIVQPRAHDFVVEQIRRQIDLGIIPPGTSLPTTRDLMQLFGVGRATVQSALARLEAEHIVETRRGRSGGSFVKAPNSDSPSLDFRVVEIRRQAESLLDVIEYREIVEPAAAAIAAKKATDELITELRDLCKKTESATTDAEFMRWDTAFHLAIGEASCNQYLSEAIEKIRLELNPALQLLPDTQIWHELSNEEHREIVDAIDSRDVTRVKQAMLTHISHGSQSVRSLIESLSALPADLLAKVTP